MNEFRRVESVNFLSLEKHIGITTSFLERHILPCFFSASINMPVS